MNLPGVPDISEHSHEIGPANLPYTKRGRRTQVIPDNSQDQETVTESTELPESPSPVASPNNIVSATVGTGPSNSSSPVMSAPPPPPPLPQVSPALNHVAPQHTYQTPIAMYVAPPQLPPQPPQQQRHPQHPPPVATPLPQIALAQERWDRMSVLFQGIRDNARTFDYPGPSVAALESILIRLYLESPIATSTFHVLVPSVPRRFTFLEQASLWAVGDILPCYVLQAVGYIFADLYLSYSRSPSSVFMVLAAAHNRSIYAIEAVHEGVALMMY